MAIGDIPIRVMLLLSAFRTGGAERQALLLAKYAPTHGMECMLASVLGHGAPAQAKAKGDILLQAQRLGIRTACLNARTALSLPAYARFVQLVRMEQPDVVYACGLRADLVARPLTRMSGCQVLLSSIRGVTERRSRLEVLLDRWSGRFVDAWISNSYAGKDRFTQRERLPAARIFVIPNGIEPWTPASYLPSKAPVRQSWELTSQALVIGTVANLREVKGHADIIHAAQEIVTEVPQARLVFIGEGHLREQLQQQTQEMGLSKYVIFAGYSSQVRHALAGIDIFLLASHSEGMPGALMEAMMEGKPCVATCVGDVPELLDHGTCGLLIPPQRPDEIVRAIVLLARDSALRQRLARAARQRVLNAYSPERMVSGTRAVIGSIVEQCS